MRAQRGSDSCAGVAGRVGWWLAASCGASLAFCDGLRWKGASVSFQVQCPVTVMVAAMEATVTCVWRVALCMRCCWLHSPCSQRRCLVCSIGPLQHANMMQTLACKVLHAPAVYSLSLLTDALCTMCQQALAYQMSNTDHLASSKAHWACGEAIQTHKGAAVAVLYAFEGFFAFGGKVFLSS